MGLGSQSYRKTKELIVYVAAKLASQENSGSTLLNKALYFIDNINYLKTGVPISELTYIKQDFGPTPDPSVFLPLRSDLIAAGDIELVQAEYFGRLQKKWCAKREANLEYFTANEVALIDSILSSIRNWNATTASEISHQYPAWQVAENKESLPLFTFLLSSAEPSEADVQWAKSQLNAISGH